MLIGCDRCSYITALRNVYGPVEHDNQSLTQGASCSSCLPPPPPPPPLNAPNNQKDPLIPDDPDYGTTTSFHPRTLPTHIHPPEHEPQPSTIFLSASRGGEGGWSARTRHKHGNLQRQTDGHSCSLAGT